MRFMILKLKYPLSILVIRDLVIEISNHEDEAGAFREPRAPPHCAVRRVVRTSSSAK